MSTKIESSSGAIGVMPNASSSLNKGAQHPAASPNRGADTVRLTGDALQLQHLERSLSRTAAVDSQRVESIRSALAEGRYRVDPERVAGALIRMEDLLGGRPSR